MTNRPMSIVHMISDGDLNVLMQAAAESETLQDLWERTEHRLGAPSVHSRRTAYRKFVQWYLSNDRPRTDAAVLAWHSFSDNRTRQEMLHLERCRHLVLMDLFVAEVLYPKLGTESLTLFDEPVYPLDSREVDNFVRIQLPHLGSEAANRTRDKLRLLLVQAGLLTRRGSQFEAQWEFLYYRPTPQAWLYGLYREFEDNGHRQRAERYVVEDSRLRRRFLMRGDDVGVLLAEGIRRGALELVQFGGESYVRLLLKDTAKLVAALANC